MKFLRELLCVVGIGVFMLTACDTPRQPVTAQPSASASALSPTAIATQAVTENSPVEPEVALSPTETMPPMPVQPTFTELPAPKQPPTEEPVFASLPTPACGEGLSPTRPDMEGPYFLAGSPEKASLLEPGMDGTPLTIAGYVLTTDCQPVAGAKLEFWQADAHGEYDLQGYRLRGHVFTDAKGQYQIQTILPAAYETRPRHIHVMILPSGEPGLTTQLYFPGDSPYPELTVALDEKPQGATAWFNFILGSN